MGKTIWRRTTRSSTWHKLWLLLFSTISQVQLETGSINLILLLIVQLVGFNEGEFNTAGCQFCDIKTMSFIYIMHHPTLQKEFVYQLFIFELEWSIYFARVYPQKLMTQNSKTFLLLFSNFHMPKQITHLLRVQVHAHNFTFPKN
jgi:hypothetical protein